ncbi:cyclic nucleotide-binding domain-containing protein [Streptomyces halobius]|uniref:Cyclic nucleotide-binding domain-containing protein n=1 Tax=Streptomyces halobius TaxID=2879846 RepID=A0ABY4MK12_9ACTN|nr:cyclic nucleotide-binding domain-containing protein [Streptomyces halobius]
MLEPGTVVFAQGQVPDGVWIVRSGTLELVSGTGRRRVVVGVLSECGIAGDVPLLLGRPAVCTVRTLTTVQAVFLPAGTPRPTSCVSWSAYPNHFSSACPPRCSGGTGRRAVPPVPGAVHRPGTRLRRPASTAVTLLRGSC